MADRTGVIVLCVRPSKALVELVTPLCPYHDVYICADRPEGDGACSLAPDPEPWRPGLASVVGGEAEAAGYRGSVSWLPDRASSRCKALYWLSRKYRGPVQHWWLLEEDVFVPTEATLLAIDARLPGADLIAPHHHPLDSRRPHWSGQSSWPHWKRARGVFDPPLFSSMVCGMRLSRALLAEIDRHAAARKRLGFCEILFSTLAAQARLRVHTPVELSTVVWRNSRLDTATRYHPALLYHPVKDLRRQLALRREHYGRDPAWTAFGNALLAERLNKTPEEEAVGACRGVIP